MSSRNRRKPELTYSRLVELLTCDPTTGILRWRTMRGGQPAGSIAGGKHHGYWLIGVDYKKVRRGRLIWLYVHKRLPRGELDHHDMVRDHDWISNLRDASQAQNNANRRAYRNNQCGFKGVYRWSGRWRAMIRVNNRGIHIGMYDTPEEAHAAYLAKANELFGEFARAH